ncbi:U3 snoRNP protein [Coemansia biformis]|uniref:U3 snoRNP protein n=1 Tax=Coemansia biformis TaxID=1286918 RepID=A0A9W8CZX3_9FUNG|nr:U3 snoRNP protein [Coemansia biformis]
MGSAAARGRRQEKRSAPQASGGEPGGPVQQQQQQDSKRPRVEHKTQAEADLERLVFGGGDAGLGGELDRVLGEGDAVPEQSDSGEGSLGSAESEDEESGGSDEEDGDASLFFMDTERDAPLGFAGHDGAHEESGSDEEQDGAEAAKPAAAWTDDDMENATVELKKKSRTRKLRVEEEEDEVAGDVYEQRLRQQFEKINPAPQWAAEAEAAAAAAAATAGDVQRVGHDLLQTSASLVSRTHALLPATTLAITRVRNANHAAESQSVVQNIQFHPTAAVLLTAGFDKTLRLFEVDGKENQKIQSIYFKDMPITTAQFIRGGQEIIVSGRRKWYYSVDVERAAVTRVGGIAGHPNINSLEFMRTSTAGDRLAFMSNSGQIHLVSARTKQFIHTLPMNGAVRDVAFTADGNYLWSVGLDNEVYQWDLRQNRCLSRWHDPTTFRPTCLGISRDGSYYASGDNAGVVNLYDTRTMRAGNDNDASAFFTVKPFKAISNLTTSVLGCKFNHNSEILGIYSHKKADQLKLVHLPTGTVFANWPSVSSHLGQVQCIDFSPQSGFMAVGNDGGKALLYRLQHYPSY